MVSKITIFEPHFDGAQFGPTVFESDESTEQSEREEENATQSSVRSRGPKMLGYGMVSFVLFLAFVAVRRARGTKVGDSQTEFDDSEIEIPADETIPAEGVR